jgi:hypothetical protein
LHDEGFSGENVIIGVLDTGFKRSHAAFNNPDRPLNVVAEWDFVNDDPHASPEPGDPATQHHHGTMVLGVLGAYMPGSLVGGSYEASFILCKTEDVTDEHPAEEDNYVAGLEFVEAHGGDLVTASLGYIDWYTQKDLDGLTAVTTIAVNAATSRGVHCCNAAGNSGHDSDPATSRLLAPADAFKAITCGAVKSSGGTATFSADGPTADGRVKPEVLARGQDTRTISPTSDSAYTSGNGTSLSTPVVAGAVACLIQARPHWTVDQMRTALFETADYFAAQGTHDPAFVRGFGIIDAFAAYEHCSDAGTVSLDRIRYACGSTVEITVVDCGLNTDDARVETVTVSIDSGSETGVEEVTLTETEPASAKFTGAIDTAETDAPGVLWAFEGDTITVTYVDADDGLGGMDVTVLATAEVDCTPPVVAGVHVVEASAYAAVVAFEADEPVSGLVRYGTDCEALVDTASSDAFLTSCVIDIAGLSDDKTYYFAVDARDLAGNVTTDDGGGTCHSFSTPDVPEYFTEQFELDNDLDNISLLFTPIGSPDYYTLCARPISELPTDPAGGAAFSMTNDSFETVELSDGAAVPFYGTMYKTIYPSSNGYITFHTGDSEAQESLEKHFAQPRVSVLFDDFDPAAGGMISWRQFDDRVAVTWEDVREFLGVALSTFQVVMYFDGRIELNYLNVRVSDGLVGLSSGAGLDPDFIEADLSATRECGACLTTAVCPFADVNCDNITDGFDIAVIRRTENWLKETGDSGNPRGDVNGDGVIDGFDVATLRSNDCWLR